MSHCLTTKNVLLLWIITPILVDRRLTSSDTIQQHEIDVKNKGGTVCWIQMVCACVCVRVCARVRVRMRGCDSEKWIRARGFLSGYLLLRPPCPGNPGSNSTQKCLGLFLLCSPCHTPLTESTLIRDHNATSLKLTWSWKDKLNPSYFWRARIRPGGRRVRTWRRCETSGPWVTLL